MNAWVEAVAVLDENQRQALREMVEKMLARLRSAPMEIVEHGGPEGIRTLGLFNAIEARSQLRHRPTLTCLSGAISSAMEMGGFEPPASTVRL